MIRDRKPSLSSADISQSYRFRNVFLGILVAVWAEALIAVFAPNRFIMASWFVVTTLTIPSALLLLGCSLHAVFVGIRKTQLTKILSYYLSVFFLVCIGLPIPLAAINLLPMGQETSKWHGRVVSRARPPLEGTGLASTLLIVHSQEIGPFLRLRVYLSQLPPVQGWVVRGFLGVPIACKWEGFVPQ